MKDPWMKWYPSDWRSDPCLRSCSLAARGLWVELLCIMHESPNRGFLVVGSLPPTPRQLASITGSHEKQIKRLLLELGEAGVYSVQEGIIYSRRMVRDEEKRTADRENGSLGGNPRLKGGVNPHDNHDDKAPDKAKKLEARSKNKLMYDEKFEEAWQWYPQREGGNPKAPAAKLFLTAIKAGEDPAVIIDGIKKFAVAERRNVGTPYIPQMVKWLRDKRWLDYLGEPTVVKFDVRKHLV